MRHLIDTQILIWTIVSPEKLASQTIDVLQTNEIFVSQISFLEIAIKQKIGELPELDFPITTLASLADLPRCLYQLPVHEGATISPKVTEDGQALDGRGMGAAVGAMPPIPAMVELDRPQDRRGKGQGRKERLQRRHPAHAESD